jgi:hypothetical protein
MFKAKFDPFRPSDLGSLDEKDLANLNGGVFTVRVVSDRAAILPPPAEKTAKRKLAFRVLKETLECWEPRCVLNLVPVLLHSRSFCR